MMRSPFNGHRRYSITHRAVQRLRELVPDKASLDDESLRDDLDERLVKAEHDGKAIHTLDAMLGEPQTLIPLTDYGEDVMYAIIKEETVVTVLPRSHGEDILQRGQAMEQRMAEGTAPTPEEILASRKRWRTRDFQNSPVLVERIVRGTAPDGGIVSRIERVGNLSTGRDKMGVTTDATAALRGAVTPVVNVDEGAAPADSPAAKALEQAMLVARRRAAIAAIREVLEDQQRDAPLLPLWNELASQGLPAILTCGDLLDLAHRR